MNEIDFEKFYEKFDLEEFLLQPIGKFSREDFKLIYKKITDIKGLTSLATVLGLRSALSNQMLTIKNDRNWHEKAHYLKQEEAAEIYFRLYFLNRLKDEFKLTE